MKKHIYIFIGINVLVNLLQAYFTPISEDEAYYWLWSEDLDWGYFDHPPMIAWWISLGYSAFKHEIGVRLFPVLFNSFSIYFLAKILSPKSIEQISLFILIFSSTLVFQAFGFLSTPDAPLLFFCILYLFSLKKFLEENSYLSSFLLAISFAGLVYSKYHGILVILFTLAPILHAYWKNPKFYLAVFLSLTLYSPHIIWLFEHDFIPLTYHFSERSADAQFEFSKIFIYLGTYFLGAAPFLSYFIFKSISKFQFKNESVFNKSVWSLAVLPGIFFFLSLFKDNVQPQWLLISFVAMTVLVYNHYSKKTDLKSFFSLGLAGVILVLIFRILITIPQISPLYKYKQFARSIHDFDVNNAIFEKYQEASIYKFYSPDKKVTVHRTIGNRKSQFSLWESEKEFNSKEVNYISPWTNSERIFVGGIKNYEYKIKNIPNYISYEFIEIQTVRELEVKSNSIIELEIQIKNPYPRRIEIGGNSPLKLDVTYYQEKQYEILYSAVIEESFTLEPNEIISKRIKFKNIDKTGEFKVCLGIRYSEIGTTYLSKPIELKSR